MSKAIKITNFKLILFIVLVLFLSIFLMAQIPMDHDGLRLYEKAHEPPTFLNVWLLLKASLFFLFIVLLGPILFSRTTERVFRRSIEHLFLRFKYKKENDSLENKSAFMLKVSPKTIHFLSKELLKKGDKIIVRLASLPGFKGEKYDEELTCKVKRCKNSNQHWHQYKVEIYDTPSQSFKDFYSYVNSLATHQELARASS